MRCDLVGTMPGTDDPAGPMQPAPESGDTGTDLDLLIDQVTDLPTVPLLLERMRAQLVEHGFLSVLSINILQNSGVERVTGWKAFDSIVRDVGRFLSSIKTGAPEQGFQPRGRPSGGNVADE